MQIITTSAQLQTLCNALSKNTYFTIDTEFIREKSFFSQLCLIQVATDDIQAIIDPLAPNIDLFPLYAILQNPNITKVFHSAKQDLEIFYFAMGTVPSPIFDTQVAAMALGYGDQIGYDTLVKKITGILIDKGVRFTDWSRRPLTQKQLQYAISDVTHLVTAYKELQDKLNQQNRTGWIANEIAMLQSPKTYAIAPRESYKKIKINNIRPEALCVLREVCAVREEFAQQKNLPRKHVLKDETLLDMANTAPKDIDSLIQIRGIPQSIHSSLMGKKLLQAIDAGINCPVDNMPKQKKKKILNNKESAVADLLKLLLKYCSAENNIAPKLIICVEDINRIATGNIQHTDVLKGWKKEIFGLKALQILDGKLAFGIKDNKLGFIEINQDSQE